MNSIIKTFKQFFFWIFNYHLSPQLDGWVHIQSKSPENMAWFIWLVMDFLFLCLICTNVPQSTNDEFSNRIFQQLFEFSSSCSRTLDLRGSLKGFTIYLLDRSWIAPSSALIFQSFCYGSTTVEYRQSLYAAVFRSAQSVPHDRSWIVPWSLRSFCSVCQWTVSGEDGTVEFAPRFYFYIPSRYIFYRFLLLHRNIFKGIGVFACK